jgi:hypothetical protein
MHRCAQMLIAAALAVAFAALGPAGALGALPPGAMLSAQEPLAPPPPPPPPPPDTTTAAAPVPDPAVALCRPAPIHTADLVERIHLDGLRDGAPRAMWSPETRLSDRVALCAQVRRDAEVQRDAEPRRDPGFWLEALPGAVETRYNSGFPRPMNDGSFRPGVGAMLGFAQGIAAGFGPLTVVVRPELHFHQNADFTILPQSVPGYSPFIHPSVGTRIDLPQRFGDDSFHVLHPGQSTIRLDWRGFVAGASTENAWWGPGLRNPLLLSSAAPGFPHAFVGTARPVDVRIGHLFVRTLVARLTESDYFDGDGSNDHQLLSGTVGAFQPAFLPGLTLGAARFFAMRDGPDLGTGEFLRAAFTGIRDNPLGSGNPLADNQHASVFARWAFPDAGLEVYGEFARIDHWGRWSELLSSPQAAGAHLWGLQKLFETDGATWRLMFEAASVVDPLPSQLSGNHWQIYWYTHSQLRQGHTHQGQLLGAPMGPGGRAQVLAVDRYSPVGDVGLELSRTLYNEESYNSTWWRFFHLWGHDLELGALLRGRRAFGPIDLEAGLGFHRRWNRHFLGLADLTQTAWSPDDLRREGNWYGELRLGWRGMSLR